MNLKRISEENIEKIYKFIVETHPQIKDDYNQVVEIRALRSDKGNKRSYRSFIFYNDTKEQFDNFRKQLNQLNEKEIPYCLFYSVFTFDPTEKKKINKDNSKTTNILVSDFDHINEEEFKKYMDKFDSIGSKPSYTIFSGHGYQCIWLLDQPVNEKEILNKWTSLLLNKGFQVDEVIKDSARIMRLPFTYNTKDNVNNYNESDIKQIETRLLEANKTIYSLNKLFININKLDSVKTLPGSNKKISEPIKKGIEPVTINDDFSYYELDKIYSDYKGILSKKFINELPAQQKSVLYHGLVNDYANAIVSQMTLYFRDIKKLDLDTILKINIRLSEINKNYNGSYNEDKITETTKRFYKSEYKFQKDVLEKFGKFIVEIKGISVDNNLFKENISNESFYIYLLMDIKVKQELKEKKYKNTFTMDDLEKLIKVKRRNIKPKLDELIKNKLIYKRVRKNRKEKGSRDTYHISIYKKSNFKQSVTIYNQRDIENFISYVMEKKIDKTTLRILLFLKYQINKLEYIGNDEMFREVIVMDVSYKYALISQETISSCCNVSQQAISYAFKKIDKLNNIETPLGNKLMIVDRKEFKIDSIKKCYGFRIDY